LPQQYTANSRAANKLTAGNSVQRKIIISNHHFQAAVSRRFHGPLAKGHPGGTMNVPLLILDTNA
jgi:hypothetical protein